MPINLISFLFFFFEKRSSYGLKLRVILLRWSSTSWDYKSVLPCIASNMFLKVL